MANARVYVLLLVLVLFLYPCMSVRTETVKTLHVFQRDNEGRDAFHKDYALSDNRLSSTKHDTEEARDLLDRSEDIATVSKTNDTDNRANESIHFTSSSTKPTMPAPPNPKAILPVQTGVQAQEEEQSNGLTIFFSLLVIGICIILVHLLIKFKLHFLPESVAVVSLGILMGGFIKVIEFQELANWKEEEMFRPNMFFLLLLPPIIFESGYSLHKAQRSAAPPAIIQLKRYSSLTMAATYPHSDRTYCMLTRTRCYVEHSDVQKARLWVPGFIC